MQEKEIRRIPKLPGGNMIIDGNKLLQQLGPIQCGVSRRQEERQ